PEACSPSSTARKLSPGTEKTRPTPFAFSASTRICPPCRISAFSPCAFLSRQSGPAWAELARYSRSSEVRHVDDVGSFRLSGQYLPLASGRGCLARRGGARRSAGAD